MDIDSSSSNNSSGCSRQRHPRRPPAHRSVSLLHSPRQNRARSLELGPGGPLAFPPEPVKRPSSSPSSLKPLIGKDDSGESSNADKWFEKSNNHASRNSTSFVDNSPPFFLQNSSSEETPPEVAAQRALDGYAGNESGSLPFRTGLLHIGTDNSSTEEFRGVIDDLTIENKKLKRMLKQYEKLHDSHLKDQKLFEVRVHGLPTAKKRELEDVLRRFAMGLSTQPGAEMHSNMFGSTAAPHLSHQKSASSSASNPFADSAYASASASGPGSSAQGSSGTKQMPHCSAAANRSRAQNIQTYLHDIPEGLLPQQPAAMTEKAKKKIIVRRLEQIFAGKGAVLGNQQPQQQQEVSQMAARMDRTDLERTGQKAPLEGLREARIMQELREMAARSDDDGAEPARGKQSKTTASPRSLKRSLEQRPTRPLDLDPYRAQIPAENFQYIRHLGFSPPGTDGMSSPEEGHGWIYLNLLSNMAQLHTINVTSDFVRKAIQDCSKKFELSSDGRKIRWKGGRTVTRTSSAGDYTPSVGHSGSGQALSTGDRGSPRKRLKVSQRGSNTPGSNQRHPRSELQENKLAYTPLFHHRGTNDTSDDSSSEGEEDTVESAFPFPQAGDSSGMTSSGVKTSSTKRNKKHENGPIIFYNNAKFCTDLSGDPKTEEAMMYNAFLYHNVSQQPVGSLGSGSTSPAHSNARGPLASAEELPEAMDLEDNPIPADQELAFPDQERLTDQPSKPRKPFRFEASGLGGVAPADNFAINVESLHAHIDAPAQPADASRDVPPRYPEKIAALLEHRQAATGRASRSAFHKRVLKTKHEEFAPSRLPNASCFMPAGDTSPEDDDDTSDIEEAMSISPGSPDAPAPSAAPQPMELDYTSDYTEDGEDESDDSDDGSLDLLATARELDPEAIRAREREYDANMAERLAEEIPAGSSAATAGGGSGFASPASNVDRESWEQAKKVYMDKREREKKERAERAGSREGMGGSERARVQKRKVSG